MSFWNIGTISPAWYLSTTFFASLRKLLIVSLSVLLNFLRIWIDLKVKRVRWGVETVWGDYNFIFIAFFCRFLWSVQLSVTLSLGTALFLLKLKGNAFDNDHAHKSNRNEQSNNWQSHFCWRIHPKIEWAFSHKQSLHSWVFQGSYSESNFIHFSTYVLSCYIWYSCIPTQVKLIIWAPKYTSILFPHQIPLLRPSLQIVFLLSYNAYFLQDTVLHAHSTSDFFTTKVGFALLFKLNLPSPCRISH